MRLKFWFYIFLLFTAIHSQSQVYYGLLGGIQQVNARVKIPDGNSIGTTAGYGFHIGGMLKAGFDKNIYFSPQLLYSFKRFTIHYNNIRQDSVRLSKLLIHYIEIPALLQFDTRADGNGLFFLFGPSVSVAIGGKEKRIFLNNSEKDRAMRFANTAYGRFEMNLLLKAGYNFNNKLTIIGGFSYGLGSIVNDDYGARIVPRTLTLSAAYFFRRKL